MIYLYIAFSYIVLLGVFFSTKKKMLLHYILLALAPAGFPFIIGIYLNTRRDDFMYDDFPDDFDQNNYPHDDPFSVESHLN